jgi:hypothetical protein
MGCSDSLNVNDPFNTDNHSGDQSNQEISAPNNEVNAELIWSQKELSVKTGIESMVEKKAVYTFPPSMPPYPQSGSYLITFDGYTNADRFTNGYAASSEISWNNNASGESQSVFQGTGQGTINGRQRIRLSEVSPSEIKFYISLFQVDGQMRKQTEPSNACILKFTNIRIYKLN